MPRDDSTAAGAEQARSPGRAPSSALGKRHARVRDALVVLVCAIVEDLEAVVLAVTEDEELPFIRWDLHVTQLPKALGAYRRSREKALRRIAKRKG